MSWSRRWKAGEAVARSVEILRRDGLAALWFKIAGEVCYRRMGLILDTLDRSLTPERKIPVRTSLLFEREIGELAPLVAIDETELRDRLRRQHLCFVGRLDGHIVGWRWYGQGIVRIDYLDADLELPSGCVFGYDVFVVSGHRRRGVSSSILSKARQTLRERGFEVRFSAIMPENLKGAGFSRAITVSHHVGLLRSLRIGPWRKAWYAPLPATEQGPHFRIVPSPRPARGIEPPSEPSTRLE